ncbi:hypothetical protein DICSQDRAFT_126466 [Dichomitus squalens LYAD-421 SS1]|uniref:NodB homology domain-containing protein n=1 Tax=Dichomitus squalens (strain LYAD-421) TaxID=732165 RepID=R7T168_DICSQ|nr:uncharacterized protein DICSQDRAFT_126466 [Dichomitus squalens LYAD-421 SS1]EJF62159.1 hypothetical protein DICSQDRAFT_126466 [Dichomitus squalens LYAD-421 SS1]
MPRKILIGFGVDADAASVWIAETSPVDVSRGMYGGEVCIPRLLKLFAKYNIQTTWFIPAHSLETFPEQLAAVRDAGHEIGMHDYLHERQSKLTVEQQKDVLDHAYDVITKFNNGIGVALHAGTQVETALGYSSRKESSTVTYYLRMGDDRTKIDYQAKAETWIKPLLRETETGLVKIPTNWAAAGNPNGWVNTRDVEQLWKDTFTYLVTFGVFFPLTTEEESFISLYLYIQTSAAGLTYS